jgi:hypothetical protein
MNINNILTENARRREKKQSPYNPITGLGCHGKRITVHINDSPAQFNGEDYREFYLPERMGDEQVVKELIQYQSVAEILLNKGLDADLDNITTFWIVFCELRYKYDFEFYAISCLTITNKNGNLIPLCLNHGQRILLEEFESMRLNNLPIRAIILKARQWGASTFVQMYMNWIQIIHMRNWNSVICAHEQSAAITIRSMTDTAIREMPLINGKTFTIRPFQQTQTIKTIPERGCRITIGTAQEPESVRSQSVMMAQFSEEAFYPATAKNNPELIETSIIPSILPKPYTLIVRESTANGIGGYFYQQWIKAKNGETAYRPIFVPWYMIELYSRPFNNGTYINENGKPVIVSDISKTELEFAKSMSQKELKLFQNHHDCTLENINWYREMLHNMPSLSKMKQDFPCDDIEAFQDSGSPVFISEHIENLRDGCMTPIAIGTLTSDCSPSIAQANPKLRRNILKNIAFLNDEDALKMLLSGDVLQKEKATRSRLKIWEYPDTETLVSNRYIVAFDPQKGISESADWGVITVLDRYWRMFYDKTKVVAQWRGREDMYTSIWIAAQIATFYNNALLVIESNTYDMSIVKSDESEYIFEVIKEYYDNLYSRTDPERIIEGKPVKYGFRTDRASKTAIIENYRTLIREEGYVERDHDALNEARTYEEKQNGVWGAKEGCHDDIIMSRMIGLFIDWELPLPALIQKVQTQVRRSQRSAAIL